MKWLIFFSVALISALGAAAQQPDSAHILVHYKFLYIRDTTHRNQPFTDNMVLLIGKNASAYQRYDPQLKQTLAGGPSAPSLRGPGSFIYYLFSHEKKLVRKESILLSDYQINETLPIINWQITSDTTNLGGFHCQKATTHFKGRDYTAWFCPDIPLSAGPWKLYGLPGVILEASDTKKEVCFTFDGLEKITALIKVPGNLTPTTEKEFVKLQETFKKDPDAFIRMAEQQSNGHMHIDLKPGPAPVVNNPIELPEKQ